MTVMAPVSALSLDALTRLTAGLPLPQAAAALETQPKMPDVVVFSSAPTRILSDLASAGLRQLATLLPMIEQAVRGDSVIPLGQLAKAAGAAARQIGDGHEALLGEGPDRIAASMPPAATTAPSVADTKQLLRTLVRQIGEDVEPADVTKTSEPARSGSREVLAGSPDRAAFPVQRQPVGQSGAPADALTDIKQSLRTLARQIGADTGAPKSGRMPEPLQPVSRQPSPAPLEAEPLSGPIQRWISEAKHLLRSTGDVLERAEEQVRPLAIAEAANIAGTAPSAWVLAEILAAQTQIASAYAAVGRARTTARVSYRVAPPSLSLGSLGGATTLFGIMLIVTTLWVVGGIWSVLTGMLALGGAAMWIWRINRASRGVTLDVRG